MSYRTETAARVRSGSTEALGRCSAKRREGAEFLRKIRIRHVVESVLRERLLFRLLVDLEHRLNFVSPEFIVEARIGHLRVQGADVARRQGVGWEFVVQDVAWSNSDELRRGGRQVLRDVSRLDGSVGDGGVNPDRPRIGGGEGR